jgi:hypothetical protein
MLKPKLNERGIPKLDSIVTTNSFQAIRMLLIQPQSQALKVLKYIILTFQEEHPRVMRIVINNDKNISFAAHGANPRGTDSAHMGQLSGLLSHHGINQRMRGNDHLAMTIRSTNKVTLKFEQVQSSE